MKKFSFALQSLLDYRLHIEEREHMKLSGLLDERRELMASISQLQTSIQNSKSTLHQKKEFFPYEIRLYRDYISNSETTLDRLMLKEQRLEQLIHLQRGALVAAAKDRKVLDRLKFTQHQKHEQELERRRQQEIDELFLLRRQVHSPS